MNTTIQQSSFSIADAPNFLTFYPDSTPPYEALTRDFRALVQSKFDGFLGQAALESKDLVQELQGKLATFSEADYHRLIFIPPFLNKIFRARSMAPLDRVAYWMGIVDRQIAVRDNVIDPNKWPAFWTMDGGTFLRAQEGQDPIRFDAPRMYDSIILDFFSEVNAGLGANEYLAFDASDEMGDYSFEEAEVLLDKLTDCLSTSSQATIDLLKTFIQVVHFRKAIGSASTSSSTNGGFIGRVLIGNAELFEPELLAEAMVHEAIHGVLFMLDELNSWMPGTREDNAQNHHIRSPWSGNLLTPRNIFQACFVWYGLYKWFDAHRELLPNKALVKRQMDLIRGGFQNLPVEDLLPDRFPATYHTIAQVAEEVSVHVPGH